MAQGQIWILIHVMNRLYRCTKYSNVGSNVNMAKLYTTMTSIFTQWIETNCKLLPKSTWSKIEGCTIDAQRFWLSTTVAASCQWQTHNSILHFRCNKVPQSDSTMRQGHGSTRTAAWAWYMPSGINYVIQKTTGCVIEKELTDLYLKTDR